MCKSLILFVEDVMVFVIKMKFEELGRRQLIGCGYYYRYGNYFNSYRYYFIYMDVVV